MLKYQDRKQLKALANPLKPTVMIGKNGVTENLLQKVDEALESHELIKIKYLEFKDQKKVISDEIAAHSHSEIIGMIGHILILYREHPDPEKRKIRLSSSKKEHSE